MATPKVALVGRRAAVFRPAAFTLLLMGLTACGGGNATMTSAPAVAGEYDVECFQFDDDGGSSCPLAMACSIRDDDPQSLTITQSAFRVMLTDGEGNAASTTTDASGEIDATFSDTQTDAACTTVRVRRFIINPTDPNQPPRVDIAFRYEGDCAGMANCSIALVGRLRSVTMPHEPCPEVSTEDPCFLCPIAHNPACDGGGGHR